MMPLTLIVVIRRLVGVRQHDGVYISLGRNKKDSVREF